MFRANYNNSKFHLCRNVTISAGWDLVHINYPRGKKLKCKEMLHNNQRELTTSSVATASNRTWKTTRIRKEDKRDPLRARIRARCAYWRSSYLVSPNALCRFLSVALLEQRIFEQQCIQYYYLVSSEWYHLVECCRGTTAMPRLVRWGRK